MARRTTRSRPINRDAPSEPTMSSDDETNAINAMLITTLTEKIDGDVIYTLSAPQTLPIKQYDGQYRQRPMTTDEEFTFKSCRIGARNQVIFEFQPMDPTKFVQMELEERNAFEALEGFEEMAINSLGGVGTAWPNAKRAWIKDEKKRRVQEVVDAETAAKCEIEDAYSSNSAFGSW
jgi:hypothetical protein